MAEEQGISALNFLGRAKEEIEAVLHKVKSSSSSSSEADDDERKEETDIGDVKAPNLLERAKEEFDAIVHSIHTIEQQKDDNQLESTRSGSEADSQSSHGKFEKVASLIEKGKEEMEELLHKVKEKSSGNQSETHGLRDDIDDNTPLSEVKAPTVFERAKEEVEAIVTSIHQQKESSSTSTSTIHQQKETSSTSTSTNIVVAGGPSSSNEFWSSLGRQLEKCCCSPFDAKKD